MANVNSMAGFSGGGTSRGKFPTQVVSTTTETALVVSTDTGTAIAFVVAPTSGSVLGASSKLDTNANPSIIGRSFREYGLPSGESNDQFSSASWDGRPFKVRITGVGNAAAQLAAPVNAAFATATSGGTLLDTHAYYYRVVAINGSGGTSLASTETTITTGNSTLNTNTVTVKWAAVAGATGYKVYGRSTGAELLMATVGAVLQFIDDGSITPAGALPTSATTNVTFNLYQGTSTTLSGDSIIGTIPATAIASAGGGFNFVIEALVQWDATSRVLSGSYTSNIGYGSSSHFVTTTVVPNIPTGVTVSGLSFLASVIFGFASASNSITVTEFVIDKL
jgi:hypothetical protein